MNAPQPLAVHVDLDGAHQIFRAHGRTYGGPGDPIFTSGVRNMLQLFSDFGITATLFVIAEDVRDPAKHALLQEAVSLGHELASHTVSHPNLMRLTRQEKEREIAESKALIENAFAVRVIGFRAPGYAMDGEALTIAASAGYVFDSSVFPTATFEKRLGRPRRELIRPQRLTSFGGIVELPLPGPVPLSSPIGPSFALAFGLPPFYWAMSRAARRGTPTVLLFHLIDFSDPLESEYCRDARMKLFTLSIRSAAAKRDACSRMVRFVQKRFRITSTAELLAPFTGNPTAAR
ncbi:MAG TPA: polysaccharide deacetylase family protein [Gemmatimonadaceae bacterium]|nr:polysaccharide deacetylase family protein [Gemmatimonadaceae bacterium]